MSIPAKWAAWAERLASRSAMGIFKLWKAWRAGRLPPLQITSRDLGVDTPWFAWQNPVQQERISSFKVSMNRTHALGLPAHGKAWIVKSLFSVGHYGAEVG
eukprot:2034310-Amphidinium_carterae.1